jgi:hypothetical protein
VNTQDLEWCVEEYFIQLFANDPALAALPRRHFDAALPAGAPEIAVEATQGVQLLGGAKGAFEVTVRILYRSVESDSSFNEDIAEAITRAVVNAQPGMTAIESSMSYLNILTEEMSGDRTNAKNVRKREKTIPVLAKLP